VEISARMRGLGKACPYYSKLFIDRMAPGIEKQTPFQSKMMRDSSVIPEQAGARARRETKRNEEQHFISVRWFSSLR
jgi:hypothetical protein